MPGPFARKTLASLVLALAAAACANAGLGEEEFGQQSAAAGGDNITPPVNCPAPTSTDQVICTDPAEQSQVAGGYFTVIGEPRRFTEAAQTFMPNKAGVPGRITLKFNRLFEPPAGQNPDLVIELRTLIGGKIDITSGTTTTFAIARVPYNAIPVGAGSFTEYTANFTSGSGGTGYTMQANTTYAMVARVAYPNELTMGIAAHLDETIYPNGAGWIRQARLIATNTFSTPAFTQDKRDMNFALSLDDGCINGKNVNCGIGECFRTVPQCTNGQFNTCVAGTAVNEKCNLKDDDCDGLVDEIADDAAGPGLHTTTCGVGACQRTVNNCISGVVQTCNPGPPAAEGCNGVDDDCDGHVDELADSAGDTAVAPTFPPLGYTTCGWGVCTRTVGNCSGGLPVTCTPDLTKKTAEVCDGLNNDCDGSPSNKSGPPGSYDPLTPTYIDNTDLAGTKMTRAYYAGPPATRSVPVCKDGIQTCASPAGSGTAVWNITTPDVEPSSDTTASSPPLGAPGYVQGTACDGLDENCDGTIDGTAGVKNIQSCWPLAASLRNVGICRDGTQPCTALASTNGSKTAETWGTCTGYTAPGSETCNGKDDDCNGSVDDGLGQTTCGSGRCTVSTANCSGGSTQTCSPNLSQAKTEVCNGVDDDCNGTVDKDSGGATLTQSCYTGPGGTLNVGICRAGTQSCTATTVSITPNSPPAYPGTGSWSACSGQVLPAGESCNGVDDNCDGAVDNPSTSLCGYTAGVTGTNCVSASCQITACSAGRFDVNGSYADGCECVDDGATTGTSCPGSPSGLGTLTKGTSASYSGKVPNTTLSDYFVLNISPTAGLNTSKVGALNITLSTNPGTDYKFQILNPSCTGFGSCGASLTAFYYADGCNAGDPNDCNYRASTWPTSIYIRVFRSSLSSGGCAGYTLSASYN